MSKTSDTVLARRRRHARVRARVQGTPERPRLCVFRSLRHIYVQVIDDTQGRTLLAVSTLDPEVQTEASAVSAASAAAARSEAGHGKKAQTKSSAATKGSPERSESGSASGAGGASATEGSPERSESRSASGAGGASAERAERAERANGKAKTQQAVAVGQVLARRALAAGIKSVVFDRGGYMYHGRVKALAEAARKGGLDF
jgi:ribosomal protein L18